MLDHDATPDPLEIDREEAAAHIPLVFAVTDPRVTAIFEASAALFRNANRQPTTRQIAYALGLGFDPSGMSKQELSAEIEAAQSTGSARALSIITRYYLREFLSEEEGMDVWKLSDAQVLNEIAQRHQKLQADFPVGSLVTFTIEGHIHRGHISRYSTLDASRGFGLGFYIKGSSRFFRIMYLSTAQKEFDTFESQQIRGVEQLRNRVRTMVERHLQNLPVDFLTAVPKTTTAVVNALSAGKKNRDFSTVTDDAIQESIEQQRGKKY